MFFALQISQKAMPKSLQGLQARVCLRCSQKLLFPQKLLDKFFLRLHSRIQQMENLFHNHGELALSH